FELLLSRRLRARGEGHLLVVQSEPPAWLERLFADAGAEIAVIDFDAEGIGGLRRLARLCPVHGVEVLLFGVCGLHQREWLWSMMRSPQRLVFWDHSSGWKRRPRWFAPIHALERLLYARRDVRMIAVSDFVRKRLVDCERVPDARVTTVYNGI